MIFQETKIGGVYEVHLDRKPDERGFFARSWCRIEFERAGLDSRLVQCSISYNPKKGTLRGMHYQSEPFVEAKLVRCTRGAIYDVILDLRPDSPTFKQWIAVTLSAENREMIYVPERCAHGFLTLTEDTEVFYQMSEYYHSEAASGVRWNDPAFGIDWPGKIELISDRDRILPDFQ
jgi:dTDP-4-dehydrorhamnose 3,5-epimerase